MPDRLVLEPDALRAAHQVHGRPRDFGLPDLLEDALAVVAASGAETVVPVAVSHAGWVAIELRRRLAHRIPALVLMDWLVLDPSPPFLDALQALQDPDRWQQTRDQLFGLWLTGAPAPGRRSDPARDGWVRIRDVARAGREIAAACSRHGSLLHMLSSLPPSDESTACGVAFELALSGRVRFTRQQLRSRIEGRHVRPRRDAVGGEQSVKLGGTPADARRESPPLGVSATNVVRPYAANGASSLPHRGYCTDPLTSATSIRMILASNIERGAEGSGPTKRPATW